MRDFWLILAILSIGTLAHATESSRDLYPDTWVATDALGRVMPDHSDVGPPKADQRRVVGIFYIAWHGDAHATPARTYNGIYFQERREEALKSDPQFLYIILDWAVVETEFRDAVGDTFHRDYPGYGGHRYRNTSGRNDIVTCKVAVDED